MPTEFVDDPEATVAEGEIVNEQTSNDYQRVWETLTEAKDAQANVCGLVVDASRGGLTVDLGVRGFIPKSEIATRNLNNLERYIGQTLEVKVLEADRESGRVVLSHRKVADEKRAAQREELLGTLEKDMVVEGVVRRITDFGAFVDIGGIDGLLHISDLAWEQVEKVDDIVKVGQKVQVKVLKFEPDTERISLGLKQLSDDPWAFVRRELRDGMSVEGEVLRVEPNGVVVRIARGVDGFIPSSEIADRRAEEQPHIEEGQKLTAKVLEIRLRERSIILSLRQAARDRERNETRDFMKKQRDDSAAPTLGDLFGDKLSRFKK
ncbi:MAG: 30S ribosomal protein S1 [Armatimonadota bacterium]